MRKYDLEESDDNIRWSKVNSSHTKYYRIPIGRYLVTELDGISYVADFPESNTLRIGFLDNSKNFALQGDDYFAAKNFFIEFMDKLMAE